MTAADRCTPSLRRRLRLGSAFCPVLVGSCSRRSTVKGLLLKRSFSSRWEGARLRTSVCIHICVCVHYPEPWLGGALRTGCVCTEGVCVCVCVSETYPCLWLGWSHGERRLFKTASLARSLSEQREPQTQTHTFPLSLSLRALLSPAPHTHICSRSAALLCGTDTLMLG